MLDKRRNKILSIVENKGYMRTSELAKIFNVSLSTIQRDLITLEQEGLLVRVWSGVKSNGKVDSDLYINPINLNCKISEEKIAKYASEYIGDNEVIFIDNSSVCLEMTKFISKKKITIVTNSLKLFNYLAGNSHNQIILTGGILDLKQHNFYGALAIDCLEHFNFNKAFLGPSRVSLDGIYTTSLIDAEVKQKVINLSTRSLVLVDKTKFTGQGVWKIASLKQLKIITDYTNLIMQFRLYQKNIIIVK